MSLPMLYEASYVVPDVEGDPKRIYLFDGNKVPKGISRHDYHYQATMVKQPTAIDFSLRLLRPKEIKDIYPLEQRVVNQIADMAMRQVHILYEFEKMEKVV